jgi:hypothetical protein
VRFLFFFPHLEDGRYERMMMARVEVEVALRVTYLVFLFKNISKPWKSLQIIPTDEHEVEKVCLSHIRYKRGRYLSDRTTKANHKVARAEEKYQVKRTKSLVVVEEEV